ncbi:MAG: hypothetical protein WC613_01180 [Candidatus Aenigmatarchaeota archaeon]
MSHVVKDEWQELLDIAYGRLDEPTRHGSQSGSCSMQDVTVRGRPTYHYFSEFQEWPSVQSSRMPFAFYAVFMFDRGISHAMHEEDILDITGLRKPFVRIPEFVSLYFSTRFGVPEGKFSLSYDIRSSSLTYHRKGSKNENMPVSPEESE